VARKFGGHSNMGSWLFEFGLQPKVHGTHHSNGFFFGIGKAGYFMTRDKIFTITESDINEARGAMTNSCDHPIVFPNICGDFLQRLIIREIKNCPLPTC